MAEHYGFFIDPCRVASPTEKGKCYRSFSNCCRTKGWNAWYSPSVSSTAVWLNCIPMKT